jgi:hypothetical protein
VVEGTELFSLNLSNPSGATLSNTQGFGYIEEDEPYVWIDYSASRAEGNTGTTAMTFTLHLSNEYDQPVTVTYDTVDGSALAGSDYVGVTGGTATIAAHTTSQTFNVLVNGDTLVEYDEYFSVNITNVSGAQLSGGWSTGYILDDDTPPTIGIYDASAYEGNSGTTTKMVFTVFLSKVSGRDVWVNYATANSSAKTSDNDYVAQSGSVHFLPGETSKTIEIVIKGDSRREQNEKFIVNLSGASGGTLADSQGVGTILNDDGGGKGNGKGNQPRAAAIDAAIDDWMTSAPKKRR